jgi:hypothetical protein
VDLKAVRQRAKTFSPHDERRQSIERRCHEVEELMAQIAELEPGATGAESLLLQLSALAQTLDTDVGHTAGFTVPMCWWIYSESVRLLPPGQQFNKPSTKEDS